jgi:hypothetical protein
MNQLRKSKRSTSFTTTNHSPVENKCGPIEIPFLVEGALYGLNKFNLTIIRLYI